MNLRCYFIFTFWRWLKKPEIGAKYYFFEDMNPFERRTFYVPLEIKGSFIKYDVFIEPNGYNGSGSKHPQAFMAFYTKVS